MKIATAPIEYAARRARAFSAATPRLRVPRGQDYVFFPHERLDGLDVLRAHCESIFSKQAEAAINCDKDRYSLFAFDKTPTGPRARDIDGMRPIVDFLCRPELVAMATDYIGEIPVLGNVCLWWSPVNSPRLGPQNIHRDMNCRRQLHLIIPIRPIDAGTGPFTFLPGESSHRIVRQINHVYGRFEDDDFFKLVSPNDMISFTSGKGDALFINPYACFHFGGRATTMPRFVLICSYTSRFESAEEGNGLYRLTNRSELSDGTALCDLLLDL